jgi:hypothetical protein
MHPEFSLGAHPTTSSNVTFPIPPHHHCFSHFRPQHHRLDFSTPPTRLAAPRSRVSPRPPLTAGAAETWVHPPATQSRATVFSRPLQCKRGGSPQRAGLECVTPRSAHGPRQRRVATAVIAPGLGIWVDSVGVGTTTTIG